jgi:hypothetical protein
MGDGGQMKEDRPASSPTGLSWIIKSTKCAIQLVYKVHDSNHHWWLSWYIMAYIMGVLLSPHLPSYRQISLLHPRHHLVLYHG